MVNIPTIREIYDEVLNDLQTEYGFTISVFGKVFLRAMAMVQAARLKLLYLAIGSVQKNIFPDTADSESVGGTLERFGRVKLGRMPFPATQGVYIARVYGTTGSTIAVGTAYKASDINLNTLYVANSSYTVTASGFVDIELTSSDAGLESALKVGSNIVCTIPIAGVDRNSTITSIVTHPTAQESIEEYRKVVLDSFRLLPQGGASADYRLWAQDAVGVKQSYPYAASGRANEVDVYIESTIEDSTDGMGTPTLTILDNASSVIESDPVTGRGRRPLGVFEVNVLPVIIDEVTITINSFLDLTPQKESLILSAITDLINNMRPFIAGADIVELRDDKISNHIVVSEILKAVPGSSFGAIEISISTGGGLPVIYSEKTFTYGHIPFLINIVYA